MRCDEVGRDLRHTEKSSNRIEREKKSVIAFALDMSLTAICLSDSNIAKVWAGTLESILGSSDIL